jgi:YHS domain-containing protein
VRALQLVLVIALIAVLLYLVFRPRPSAVPRPVAAPDELVKDPVCQTYVVRSRALSRPGADGPVYFCGAECARRYAARAHG